MDDSSRQLVVEPICGLSNRLRALAFAARIAALSGRKLVVIWNNHHPDQARHSNCRLEDLFDHDLPQVSSFEAAGSPATWFVRYPRHTPFRPLHLPGVVSLNENSIDLARFHDAAVVGITTFEPLHVPGDCPEAAGRAAQAFARGLRPLPWIEEAVRTFQRRHFHGPMLGVHIRRDDFGSYLAVTGHRQTEEEDFWAYVAGCLARRPALRAFCASDDAGVKERFVRRFGDRACTCDVSSLDRRTSAGVQDALIDLLLLARTDFICATPRSTFGRAAQLLRPADCSPGDVMRYNLPAGISGDAAEFERAVRHTLAALDASHENLDAAPSSEGTSPCRYRG